MRQIILDTETTGLEVAQGHRVIEIGALELDNRRPTGRTFHRYLNPDRDIDEGALQVHGISREFLASQPRFEAIAEELLAFLVGAELVIHNAPFDVGFLDAEIRRGPGEADSPSLAERCSVLDTLTLARQLHPGQRNTLDALCKRYGVDNSGRDLHGALLDAKLLSEVYLAMTGGQAALTLAPTPTESRAEARGVTQVARTPTPVPMVQASEAELARHARSLDAIESAAGGACLFRALP